MTQKSAKQNGSTRATLADIAKEMAKPRLAVSVREAAEIAEEDVPGQSLHPLRGKSKD
jgi:hypothetical protein